MMIAVLLRSEGGEKSMKLNGEELSIKEEELLIEALIAHRKRREETGPAREKLVVDQLLEKIEN